MTDDPMPDFVSALERRLRDHATGGPARPSSTPRRARPRIALALAATGALAVAAVVVGTYGGSSPSEQPRADRGQQAGRPLILKTAAVDAQKVIDEVQSGVSVRLILGDDARLTAARPVAAFGGTAYVLTGDKGWCLVAPDDAIDVKADPARSGGLTCQKLDTVYRFGVPLIVGHNGIAAVPQGVPAPTLTTPDGAVRRLEPSDQGVVLVAGATSGSILTLYSHDGAELTLHFP